MHHITGTSTALVKEYLELAKKHFPDPNDIKNYLVSRGIKVEELLREFSCNPPECASR